MLLWLVEAEVEANVVKLLDAVLLWLLEAEVEADVVKVVEAEVVVVARNCP